MPHIDTGWKKDMEELLEHTAKNWWNTGQCTRPVGVTGSISLGNLEDKKAEEAGSK